MQRNVHTMKSISGNADQDRIIAAEFSKEAIEESQARLDRIQSIADLSSILDHAQLAIAADARAGIRHIHAAVKDVSEFHKNGSLAQQLNVAPVKIGKMLEAAEELYHMLHDHYYRD